MIHMRNIHKAAGIALSILISASAWSADLTVSAAASLTQAFQEIGTQFEAQHPGIKLKFNFGSSGALLQQIVNGAPVDVFASADTDTMDKALAKNVVNAADVKIFTSNRLVVVTPAKADLAIKQLSDLKKPDVKRFAMGVPASVPAGHYAQGALDKAGLWNDVKDKVISTQNVRQALDYVARNEVDAGFVYASDALLMADKVKVVLQVSTATPIQYPIAKTAFSPQASEAQKFVAFVQSNAGQAVLKKHGFSTP
jgi:molybdate transport system substrate-binding protein